MIFFAMLAIKVLRPLCEHFLFIQIEKNNHYVGKRILITKVQNLARFDWFQVGLILLLKSKSNRCFYTVPS